MININIKLSILCLIGIFCSNTIFGSTITADPSNYILKINSLQAGDTLLLSGGSYVNGFDVTDRVGRSDAWIIISGPESGPPAIIEGRPCCNTVQLRRAEYIHIKNLVIDGKGLFVDGINAKDGASHHITIENNTIINFGADQQNVGINTKSSTWDWVIRNNIILEAGTGIYLGDSDGSAPFIGGIIEGNYIVGTTGYCMEIKHQNSRPNISGIPTEDRITIIKNNVFIKDARPSPDGVRPSLLVDGFPATGNGSNDLYEIYGNFLYNNPNESLIQASGRVSIHDNIFVQPADELNVYLTSHNHPLKLAYVYNNTVYGGSNGIRFGSTAQTESIVTGNLILSTIGIGASDRISVIKDNIIDTIENAVNYVNNPSTTLSEMDFFPLANKTKGPPLDITKFLSNIAYNKDFNGANKGLFEFRGAYAGEGTNPGWKLASERKSGIPPDEPDYTNPPLPPAGIIIQID